MQCVAATEKISISLPSPLLKAIDRHLKPNETRSGYFQIIARDDLEQKGVLTPAQASELVDQAVQAARTLEFSDEQIAAHISQLCRAASN